MTKPIDFKARWEKALDELDEVRKLSETRKKERDAAVREWEAAVVRADMKKPDAPVRVEYIEHEVLPFGVAVFLFTLAAVCGAYMLSAYHIIKQLQLPIYTPYEVKVTKIVKPERAIWFIKEASAALENRHLTKANDLLHDAVIDLESDDEGDID